MKLRASTTDGPDGVLIVDKPQGCTSHDVVAVARRALGTRQVGHTGTLDPMATGVLALLVGRATRLARFLSADCKEYDAHVRLGIETDSWDLTGTVLREQPPGAAMPEPASAEEALRRFIGRRNQVPPPFSAKKIGGVRAYELARRGEAVPLQPVTVELHEAEAEYEPPILRLKIRCSAGFYVRSLAHDLGVELGCGASLEALRRTASGSFTLASALEFERLAGEPGAAAASLVPLDAMLPGLPAVTLNDAGARKALHGNEVGSDGFAAGMDPGSGAAAAVRLMGPDRSLLAVARPGTRPGSLHPVVVLK